MIQWSPDSSSGFQRGQPASYLYEDASIRDFSLNHLSGPGCTVYGDFPIMPVPGALAVSPAAHPDRFLAPFTHADEKASPGVYSVKLGTGVSVDLAVTMRSGLGRFAFPPGHSGKGTVLVSIGRDATKVRASSVETVGDRQVSGQVSSGGFCGMRNRYIVYFAAEFNRSFESFGTWKGNQISPGSRAGGGPHSGAFFTFDTAASSEVEMKVALSYVSVANAWSNMRQENAAWDFDALAKAARDTWNQDLSRIRIEGGTPSRRRVFYTALYHVLLQPNVFSDVNGDYMGFDDKVHTARSYTQYANFSGWDIYRSDAQLLALLDSGRTSDMMRSLLADAEQGGGGLPIWPVANDDSCVMVGAPSYPIIASAYAFGARHFDAQKALQIMVHGATDPAVHVKTCTEYPHLSDYLKYGYYSPDEHSGPSQTLEFGAADFSAAQLAKELGDTKAYQTFIRRAQFWKNTFNPKTGYIEPRHNDGPFFANFNPASDKDFVEGNASQYTFMIPWDFPTLFHLLGGPQKAVVRLNALFEHVNAGPNKPYAWMGNEPGLDIPWAYDFAGAPWRTQEVVRKIDLQLFTPKPDGIPGNDDLGEMSSWYVFSALGLYPEVPGVGGFCLGSPMFSNATWRLSDGSTLTIECRNAVDSNPYVQSLTLNGTPYKSAWLPYGKLEQGATLAFKLGSSPVKSWGSAPSEAPPSFIPNTQQGATYPKGREAVSP